MYSIRLISADSYQIAPISDVDPTFSQFRGSDIKQVPVIRIFGTTTTGNKVCLHVHGVFPYMYVPYSGQDKADILTYRLAASLDAAINISFGSANSTSQHIYKIKQVSGIPFYGYHEKLHHFLKIYFYNPAVMKRATELLQNGCVLGQVFQPYEAHIPFILQFMIDYNIYGMSMVNIKNVKHRYSVTADQNTEQLVNSLDELLNCNADEKEYLPLLVKKQSVIELEIDVWASDILNREVIDKGIDLNPGIAAIWKEEKARRAQMNLGGDSQLMYPESPKRSQKAFFLKSNEIYHKKRFEQHLYTIRLENNESSLSPSLENSSYPLPVPNNSKLLHASQVEIHTSSFDTTTDQKFQNKFVPDVTNESMILSLQSDSMVTNLSLDSSDLNIVDMLVNLAEDQEIPSSIDSNSILGSQKSQQAYEDLVLPNDKEEDHEAEEEVEDLNITSLELDSLNFSLWDFNKKKSQSETSERSNNSQIELALESLNEESFSYSPDDNIPQLDGPIDDEKMGVSHLKKDIDVTIESKEFLICNYKAGKGSKSHITNVSKCLQTSPKTPRKKKRDSHNEEEDTNERVKRKKTEDCLPKTPRRTPSKRKKTLTSPSCPSRTYSPLNIEITNAQKSKQNQSNTSPSISRSREYKKTNFKPKKLLTTVKECDLGKNDIPPIDLESIKKSIKTSEKLFNRTSNSSDSDRTLVEDSDDSDNSDKTIIYEPKAAVIINDTDSNDSNKRFDLYDCNQPTSPLLGRTSFKKESFFSQLINTNKEILRNKISCSPVMGRSNVKLTLTPNLKPPSVEEIEASLISYENSQSKNVKPVSSKQIDDDAILHNYIDDSPVHQVKNKELSNMKPYHSSIEDLVGFDYCRKMKAQEFRLPFDKIQTSNLKENDRLITIRPAILPPSVESVCEWLKEQENEQKKIKDQIDNKSNEELQDSKDIDNSIFLCTPSNSSKMYKNTGNDASKHLGISCGQIEFSRRSSSINVEHGNLGNAKALTTYQFLTIFCLEVHVTTRSNLLPDPEYDAIEAVFYAIYNDVPPDWPKTKPLECGMIMIDSSKITSKFEKSSQTIMEEKTITYVQNEDGIFDGLLSIIERCDPEILIGWDIELFSWGYMFQRASFLKKNFSGKISRIPKVNCNWETERNQSNKQLLVETISDVKVPGRIVLEVWRIMRHEIALTSYTYENVMFHIMNERIPYHSFEMLTKWWQTFNSRWRVVDYYINKVIGVHRMLHHLDIINRTSEHARLYGIQFYEVFSRGSQFRVESMMLRLAKPLNYIPISPSNRQRGSMRAPESLPLILEPESTMYTDPVVVLDFQSLYPSIIIAYNYCFSTCLGRIDYIGSSQPFEFGAASLKVDKKLAVKLRNKITFAPCGVAYVKKEIRQGILPRMLTEILETRLMVKKAIKDHSKDDRALQRALDSRQLGLKLIANVTYGYTAANFSGRMPCIEVGDSVVSKGKETLEGAIKIVESEPKWGARVVYGDTDSLFILLKGKSREEAFKIGAEMAETVTAANPKPVKLKFEKVMQPCILQTKKRYCGYKYENLNDKPVYLAKGIETVRRDGCPAVSKILEKTLKILFDTNDLSLVKEYVTRQLDKILTGRVSIHDLIFAKEFRGMTGYKPAACVPALELTKRLIQKDPRSVPRTGARVPYIIVAGGPNEPLIRCVRSPMEVLLDESLRPNATYYITKVIIPPINRCLNLIGVDAYTWFMEMPHRQSNNKIQRNFANVNRKQKITISQYLCNITCPCCGDSCDKGICKNCIRNQSRTLVILYDKCRQYERIYSNIKTMCESCIGVMDADSCTSLDCPIFYRRIQAQIDSTQISYLYNLIESMEHLF